MHQQLDADLRAEADQLLASGLREVLADYGEVHIVGSYHMRLMAWRDLDIHLVRDTPDTDAFFALGARIVRLLSPQKMHYRDETNAAVPEVPGGIYWGVYLGNERSGAWKIDIWSTGPAGLARVQQYCADIAKRLTDAKRDAILRIKSECWQHPEYRRAFSSADIYRAVLDQGITDSNEFWSILEQRNLRRTTSIA